jgi:hypothetical protein
VPPMTDPRRKHPSRWEIEDPEGVLTRDSQTRRRLDVFARLHGLKLAAAVKLLLDESLSVRLGPLLPQPSAGGPRHGATDDRLSEYERTKR